MLSGPLFGLFLLCRSSSLLRDEAGFSLTCSGFFRRKYGEGQAQLTLRYGMNPHQKPACVFTTGPKLPFMVPYMHATCRDFLRWREGGES